MSVDLPAPFSPQIAWISPRCTSKLTFESALTPGKVFVMPRISRIVFVTFADFLVGLTGGRWVVPAAAGCAPRRRRGVSDGCRGSEAEVVLGPVPRVDERRLDVVLHDLHGREQVRGDD